MRRVENHEAFAQFTLALQDIASQDTAAYYSPPPVIVLTAFYVTKVPDPTDPTKALTVATSEYRAVKREKKEEIEKRILASLVNGKPIDLTRAQWLAYTDLYTFSRTTATGTPATSLPARALSSASTGASSGQAPTLGRPAPAATFQLH